MQVTNQMGDSKIETTKNIYGHLFAQDRASILKAMNQAVTRLYVQEDADEATQDVAAWAREVRRRVGLSQSEFSRRIGVPVTKVRDWESGRQAPVGPERAVLRLIAHSPKTALAALTS